MTLTGAGGSGKTLLAVHVAADLGQHFADGVSMVELAALADAELVPAAVAAGFGVLEKPGQQAVETLLEYLRPKAELLRLQAVRNAVHPERFASAGFEMPKLLVSERATC